MNLFGLNFLFHQSHSYCYAPSSRENLSSKIFYNKFCEPFQNSFSVNRKIIGTPEHRFMQHMAGEMNRWWGQRCHRYRQYALHAIWEGSLVPMNFTFRFAVRFISRFTVRPASQFLFEVPDRISAAFCP